MSRIIDILNVIKNEQQYNNEALSRAEAILKSIANNTEYTEQQQSRFETLLLALKNETQITMTAQTRIENMLIAIANNTLDAYLAGKNLFNESKWNFKESIDGNNCLFFDGFFTEGSGTKQGNPLILKTNLKAGTYTVTGKFKKTTFFNALCVMSNNNVRQALGTMADNFEVSSITFTINSPMKYLYVDTGRAGAKGYCKEYSLKFEMGTPATPYTPYAFQSALEEAFFDAFIDINDVYQDGDRLVILNVPASKTGEIVSI